MKLTRKLGLFMLCAIVSSVILAQDIVVQSVANAGEIQFFVLEGPWTIEHARYELWASQGSKSLNQLKLPKGQYLLGMSRKIDQKDAPFIDRTYNYPGPFGKGTDQKVISKSKDAIIPVDFNPKSSSATLTIEDGIVCWNWQEGISLVARPGQKGISSYLLGAEKYNRDPLIAPLAKGEEVELQLVITEEKPVELRKVFIIESQQKIEFEDTLRSYSKLKPF
jgi:hypothetical protein